jgi:hypothetical protein
MSGLAAGLPHYLEAGSLPRALRPFVTAMQSKWCLGNLLSNPLVLPLPPALTPDGIAQPELFQKCLTHRA